MTGEHTNSNNGWNRPMDPKTKNLPQEVVFARFVTHLVDMSKVM
jgi:hypothetical protein